MIFISFSFFVLGAILASFVGVLTERLHTGTSVVRGRSCCDSCGKELGVLELVPILSYLASCGRARCCGARISKSSTVVELLLGGFFVLAYLRIGFTLSLPFFLIALTALTALVLYDLRHTILPPSFLAVFLLAALGFSYLEAPDVHAFFTVFLVGISTALFLAFLHLASRGRAMGLADAPLAFGLSLLSGPAALSGFIFSFWIGALVGITLLVRMPKGSRMGVEVPFAPFLACGFLLAYFTSWNPFTLISELMARLLGG